MDRSESTPLSVLLSMGTPSTGRRVYAAAMPGRWAAPPAPAMITSRPRSAAAPAYSARRCGVRWAETMRVSCGTPNWVSVSATLDMVAQSDLLPMMTPTSGFSSMLLLLPLRERIALLAVKIAQRDRHGHVQRECVHLRHQQLDLRGSRHARRLE